MKIKKYIILFLLFSIFGCQSESEKDDSNIVDEALPVTINAQNFVVTSKSAQSFTVNLEPQVVVSDDSEFSITQVERLTNGSADCAAPQIRNATLLIPSPSDTATAVCDYRYTVASAAPITNDSVTSGVMRLVTPSPRATVTVVDMMPISAAVLLEGGAQTINVGSLLTDMGETLTGFTLLSTYSHAYPYSGGVTINASAQTLTYTPASTVGHDRILFTYTNTTSNTNKLGILDVVVGEGNNQGLTIKPTCYHPTPVLPNTNTLIDISGCVTTDHDSKDYGLNRVDSFYATVSIASAAWNEKRLNFQASESRYHDVTYMVDDGKGGTEMGILRVAVGDPDQLPGWEGIEIGVIQYFTAPKSVLESLYSDTVYSELLTDNSYSPAIDIAGYHTSEAIAYCQALGASLPTTAAMQDLVNNPAGKPKVLKDWPITHHYLANDGTTAAPDYRTVNLDDGTVGSVVAGQAYQVTCYKEGYFALMPKPSRCAAPGYTANFETTVIKGSGTPYASEYVNLSLPPLSTTAEFNPKEAGDNYFTDANGQFDFGVQDSTEGEVTITATAGGATASNGAYFGYVDIVPQKHGYAFSAIKPDRTVESWGFFVGNPNPPALQSQLTNVDKIFPSDGGVFVALTSDGRVVTWGHSGNGGDSSAVQSQLTNVNSVFFTVLGGAAALKSDGSVVTWGDSTNGGDSSAVQSQLTNVTTIFSGWRAFAALKSDGSVVTWGDSTYGGDSSAVQSQLTNVTTIFSNRYALAALKSDGTVVTWGNSSYGGDSSSVQSQLTGVDTIFSGHYGRAFAALRSNGTVVTWGHSSYGGDSSAVQSQLMGVKTIVSTSQAFAALKSDGTVVTWGNSSYGGDSSAVQSQLTGVDTIVSAHHGAFAALKSDGTVVTWGRSDYGGDSSSVQSQLTGVDTIFSSDYAFAALKSDGTVVTWGLSTYGGDSSSVQSQLTSVDTIFAIGGAFVALKSDGTVVGWGRSGGTSAVDLNCY
ncbi:hypothetical protein [Vibrio hippocampi]|uniref:Lipoprotein n=1 Tax=Vibrio hippocampi TaxID=654686 RepID=A0ABN8DQF7_9VIBR|nr:hypothetical protein [Vibrio hippocampi]CAH0530364.1 hypothetical protein VHP8226_04007 [Vibrio hippocampi]